MDPLSFTATKPGSTPLGLEEAHRELHITPEEFDEVAAELGRTLDHLGVPAREKDEVLAAFAAHKGKLQRDRWLRPKRARALIRSQALLSRDISEHSRITARCRPTRCSLATSARAAVQWARGFPTVATPGAALIA